MDAEVAPDASSVTGVPPRSKHPPLPNVVPSTTPGQGVQPAASTLRALAVGNTDQAVEESSLPPCSPCPASTETNTLVQSELGRSKAGKQRVVALAKLLPDADKVAELLIDAADREPESFLAGDLADWDAEYRQLFYIHSWIRAMYLEELQGRTYWEQAKNVLHGWWNKGELVKLVQTVKHLSAIACSTASLGQLVSFMVSSERLVEDSVQESHVLGTLLRLYGLLVRTGLPFCRSESFPMNQNAEKVLKLLSMPVPDGLRNARSTISPGTKSVFRMHVASVSGALRTNHLNLDASWFGYGVPVGPTLMWLMFSLKTEEGTRIIDQSAFEYGLLEEAILTNWRSTVSSIIGLLEERLEQARFLQAKILGVIATVFFAALSYLSNKGKEWYEDS